MSENEDSTNEENNELIDNPGKTDDQTKKLEEENSDLKDKWQRALADYQNCLLYTSPSPRDRSLSRMPSSA